MSPIEPVCSAVSVSTEAQDEQRICRFYNSRGGCWRGEMCPFEHTSNSGLLLASSIHYSSSLVHYSFRGQILCGITETRQIFTQKFLFLF